jgi:hypothetical protein
MLTPSVQKGMQLLFSKESNNFKFDQIYKKYYSN